MPYLLTLFGLFFFEGILFFCKNVGHILGGSALLVTYILMFGAFALFMVVAVIFMLVTVIIGVVLFYVAYIVVGSALLVLLMVISLLAIIGYEVFYLICALYPFVVVFMYETLLQVLVFILLVFVLI